MKSIFRSLLDVVNISEVDATDWKNCSNFYRGRHSFLLGRGNYSVQSDRSMLKYGQTSNITTAILYPDWSRTGWPPLKTESSYARNTGHGGSPYMVSTHSSEENEWNMYQLYFYLNEIQSLNIPLNV